jgi:uridine kinase
MPENRKVIIIAGPAGSGKTTTALRIAQNNNWSVISEDEFWVEIKKGHPEGEMRTPEEESIIQKKTLDKVLAMLASGSNVVLEFILYQNPPTPIIFYQTELERRNIEVLIRLLVSSRFNTPQLAAES